MHRTGKAPTIGTDQSSNKCPFTFPKAYFRAPLCQHLQGTGTNKIEIKDLGTLLKELVTQRSRQGIKHLQVLEVLGIFI